MILKQGSGPRAALVASRDSRGQSVDSKVDTQIMFWNKLETEA